MAVAVNDKYGMQARKKKRKEEELRSEDVTDVRLIEKEVDHGITKPSALYSSNLSG